MHDINKIIIFIFVVTLLIYMIKLSFFIKQKEELRTHAFSIMFAGVLMVTIATFLDMMIPIFNNKFISSSIKICFLVGAIFYIVGVILWSNYNNKVIEEFEKLALKDAMTEVFNRNGIEKIYRLISETKKPFYVGICDLDGLKKINDKFGHLQGDEYILRTAKIIVDAIGTKGYVGRIGGDEFIIILEYQDEQQLDQIVAKVKQSVYKIFTGKNTGISFGYSMFPNDGNNLEELIKVADARMYTDKGSRRRS